MFSPMVLPLCRSLCAEMRAKQACRHQRLPPLVGLERKSHWEMRSGGTRDFPVSKVIIYLTVGSRTVKSTKFVRWSQQESGKRMNETRTYTGKCAAKGRVWGTKLRTYGIFGGWRSPMARDHHEAQLDQAAYLQDFRCRPPEKQIIPAGDTENPVGTQLGPPLAPAPAAGKSRVPQQWGRRGRPSCVPTRFSVSPAGIMYFSGGRAGGSTKGWKITGPAGSARGSAQGAGTPRPSLPS